MSSIRPRTVEVETAFRSVAPDPSDPPVRVSLRYNPAEPYTVHALFHAPDATEDGIGEAVNWSFARELLATGLDEPAGVGDVQIWPWRDDFVALSLDSWDGSALFEVSRPVLARFLRRTYAVVPRGEESEHLDLEAELAELFGREG